MAITRFVLRWGLIGGLGLVGATLLVGPERVAASLAHVRGKAQSLVDRCTDNPEALRRELARLADEYPDRIAEVRGEIAEVDHQLGQFARDTEIANRVVALTTDDLNQLKSLVRRAEARSESSARPVAIRFGGARFDIDEAYTEARRINNVRQSYRDRLAHDTQQLAFLEEQKDRLTEILDKLESEFSTYQTQLWQLDRQIDAIQRNDRLIELTEQQQATLDSFERFGRIGNLKQLEAKLAELRTIQEAQLQALEKKGLHHDYQAEAELEVDGADANPEDPFAELYDIVEPDENEPAAEEISDNPNSLVLAN